jgi:proton-dependent oligopeptide transporter, POT family
MPTNIDDAAAGAKHDPSLAQGPNFQHNEPAAPGTVTPPHGGRDGTGYYDSDEGEYPTEDELHSLRRVPGHVPWKAFALAFVELCERFSYYGTTVVFTNFIQQKMPDGSRTGAGKNDQSGALGRGQRASTGIGTFNQFWVYLMPLFGAWVADAYLGRYRTIAWALGIAITGHIILTVSAVPTVITHPENSLACFLIGLIIMGVGTGAFKSNISPLIAEQLPQTKMVTRELPSGERVIIDPTVTQSRVYHYFYLFINVGALVGQIGMVYAEKWVGFWLSFLLPTVLLCVCPLVVLWGRNRYIRTPPEGSVLGKATRLFILGNKGRWHFNPVTTYKHLHDGTFWEGVKPSTFEPANRPHWMTFDDAWVDEVRRGFNACSVFLWFPLYWLTYNQLNNNLVSQAAVMKLNGLPNDILSNLDPFALIILIPICDLFLWPLLRKMKINFTPIKKITWGFYTGALAMVWAAVIQAYIYKKSECGRYAAGTLADGETPCAPVDINVWAQTGSYILIAISEILASITGLEYAFSKAPKNMRSLVMSVFLFQSALSAAIGEAFVSLSADPLLVWNYGVMGVLSAIGGTIFWFQFRGLDKEEDHLNMLPVGHLANEGDLEAPEKVLRYEEKNLDRQEATYHAG